MFSRKILCLLCCSCFIKFPLLHELCDNEDAVYTVSYNKFCTSASCVPIHVCLDCFKFSSLKTAFGEYFTVTIAIKNNFY